MNETVIIGIGAGTIIGEKLYFSATELNGLFTYDLRNDITEYMCPFKEERIHNKTHLKAFAYNDKVWFVPYEGEYISCYDVNSRSIFAYKVWDYIEGKHAFIDAVRHNDKIFLVPRDTDFFLEIDLETQEIREISKILPENKGRYRSVAVLGNNLLGVLTTNGSIVKTINIDNLEERILEPEQEGEDQFLTAVSDGGALWLVPFNSKEVRCVDLVDYSKNKNLKGYIDKQYYGGMALKDYIAMYPFSDDGKLLCINKNDFSLLYKTIYVDYREERIPIGFNTIESMIGNSWVGTENGYLIKMPSDFNDEVQVRKILFSKETFYDELLPQYEKSRLLKSIIADDIIYEGHGTIDLDMFINLINRGKGGE